jgi:hypothetical protein
MGSWALPECVLGNVRSQRSEWPSWPPTTSDVVSLSEAQAADTFEYLTFLVDGGPPRINETSSDNP